MTLIGNGKDKGMIRRYGFLAVTFVLLQVQVAGAQHPILDSVANKVIQKWQSATCEQLWQERMQHQQGKPESQQEKELLEVLNTDPQMRTEFINKIAAPVANKMFECGMIP